MPVKRNFMKFLVLTVMIPALLLSACTLTAVKPLAPEAPLRLESVLLEEWPVLEDDSDFEGLERAVTYSLGYLKGRPPGGRLVLADRELSRQELIDSLTLFLNLLQRGSDRRAMTRQIKESFNFYRFVQGGASSPLLMTGYYEPVLRGSRVPSAPYLYPVYRVPEDQVFIQAGRFSDALKGRKWVARLEGNQVVPYYTRQEIDQGKALEGKDLEILWVDDPIKLFFMHIQGSGQVLLEDGSSVRVGYGGSNGHSYFAIGRELVQRGLLKAEEVSLQSLYAYLRDHPEEKQKVMNLNSSYVFFREVRGGPFGSLGLPLTPGRSAAVDLKFFPSGGLGFISGLKPSLDSRGRIKSWEPFSRWVCFQDSGGAIKGPSRLDLYWGTGAEAEMAAGHLRHPGSVFILLKKPNSRGE